MPPLPDGGHSRTSRQELLNELKRLANDLDHTPTFEDMNRHGKYSALTYRNHFDSWNNAIKTAGMEPNTPRQYTDDDLLEHLQEFATELNHTPTSKEMNKHGPHTSKTYKDRFDTWNNALKQAGLEPNREAPTARSERERKQQLLEDLVELAEDLGRVPTQKEIREHTTHSHTTYYNHWGGIKEALEASELDLDSVNT